MPVSGLPVAVNAVLTDLLQEQALTSWKVVGDTTVTVVVLRFSPPTLPPLQLLNPTAHKSHSRRISHPARYEEIVREQRRDRKQELIRQVFQIFLIARRLYLCQHHLPNEVTLTVGLLKNNSLTVHTLSVIQTRVKPGKRSRRLSSTIA